MGVCDHIPQLASVTSGLSTEWTVSYPSVWTHGRAGAPISGCWLTDARPTGGENIKSINQQSGAHVELQRNPPPSTDPGLRIFTIRGAPQQIEVARHLIDEKVGVRTG